MGVLVIRMYERLLKEVEIRLYTYAKRVLEQVGGRVIGAGGGKVLVTLGSVGVKSPTDIGNSTLGKALL